MKIAKIEDLHCDAGWRDFSFLKITTDNGIVGWSEYNESYGGAGLTTAIRRMGQTLIGKDPRPTELITATLYAITRQAPGGINQQAIAAIENALLDVKARVWVFRSIRCSAAQCARNCRSTGRIAAAIAFATRRFWVSMPVRKLDDLVALGRHVKSRGFKALKTNIFRFDLDPFRCIRPASTEAGVSRTQRRTRPARRNRRRPCGLSPGRRTRHGASS